MPTRTRPRTVLAAAAVVGLQATVIAVFGTYLIVAGFVSRPSSVATAELAGALTLAAAAALALVVRGVLRGRRWSRSPAVLTQALSLPVGWGVVQGGKFGIGLPVIAVAVAALVLLFVPATNAALAGDDFADPSGS